MIRRIKSHYLPCFSHKSVVAQKTLRWTCLTLAAVLCIQTATWAQTNNAPRTNNGNTAPVQTGPAQTVSGAASATKPGATPAASNNGSMGLQDLVAMLNVIDPYRPTSSLESTIHVFGSTAMDNMAHAWADDFKLFHPKVKVEVSAAGSGDAFGQLKLNPQAVAMLSRPVKPEELKQIKSDTIKRPVAFVVAREALGVFVHSTNPAQSITGDQLRAVFTKETADADLKWKLLGVTGSLADQPIHLVSRAETSGTQSFLREFVFGGMEMRSSPVAHGSNSDVLGALANDPLGITICGLRANGTSVRALPLISQGRVVPSDDAAVLGGQYPLTRNLTVVIDLDQTGTEAKAAQEFVHFALCRTGQLAAIRAGFFPAELPTLRAGLSLLQRDQMR